MKLLIMASLLIVSAATHASNHKVSMNAEECKNPASEVTTTEVEVKKNVKFKSDEAKARNWYHLERISIR